MSDRPAGRTPPDAALAAPARRGLDGDGPVARQLVQNPPGLDRTGGEEDQAVRLQVAGLQRTPAVAQVPGAGEEAVVQAAEPAFLQTDIQTGPDGALYLVGPSRGWVRKIDEP